ncbi:MAG: hypothetical protein WAM68_03740 [Acidobacteriaceae bacterium]
MSTSDPFTGRYLFHLHTSRTDGKLLTREHFDFARTHSLERLIFLEHVRRISTYDVREFAAEIRCCDMEFGIPALVGFEAKILPDGALDIGPDALDLAEVVGMAEHGFRESVDILAFAMMRAIGDFRAAWPGKHLVWVHPGLYFQKAGIAPASHEAFAKILQFAIDAGVRIEDNTRYGLPGAPVMALVPEHLRVRGGDCHTAQDLEKWLAQVQSG